MPHSFSLSGMLAVGPEGHGRRTGRERLAPGFLLNDPLMTGNTPGAIMDCGQAIAQATLVAYDEGLGSCLMGGPILGRVGRRLKIPASGVPLVLQAVGYPAESWEAGGQTHKPPLEELFFEMEYGNGFRSDPAGRRSGVPASSTSTRQEQATGS